MRRECCGHKSIWLRFLWFWIRSLFEGSRLHQNLLPSSSKQFSEQISTVPSCFEVWPSGAVEQIDGCLMFHFRVHDEKTNHLIFSALCGYLHFMQCAATMPLHHFQAKSGRSGTFSNETSIHGTYDYAVISTDVGIDHHAKLVKAHTAC